MPLLFLIAASCRGGFFRISQKILACLVKIVYNFRYLQRNSAVQKSPLSVWYIFKAIFLN